MDYLYGEMSEVERKAFEAELASDSSLQKELEGMRQARHMLAELPDVEPAARLLSVSNEPTAWKRWGPRAGVAAAVLLLLWVFNARLEWTGRGLIFALGDPSASQVLPATSKDAAGEFASFEQLLERREEELQSRLLTLDSAWQQRILARESVLRQDWQAYRATLRSEQRQQIEQWKKALQPELIDLIQQTQLEQQRELRLLLTDLYNEWQQTRQADLESIQKEFVNLYRNVEYNQQEVEAVLDQLGRVGD